MSDSPNTANGSKWNSRKLVGVAVYFTVATLLLMAGFIGEMVWFQATGAAFFFWVAGQAAVDGWGKNATLK